MQSEELLEKARRNTRTYEVTWSDGRKQLVTATQVHTGLQTGYAGQSANVIQFMGPMGNEDGTGWAGRLLLSGVMSTGRGGIVSVRNVGVDMPIVHVEREPKRGRWPVRSRARKQRR